VVLHLQGELDVSTAARLQIKLCRTIGEPAVLFGPYRRDLHLLR